MKRLTIAAIAAALAQFAFAETWYWSPTHQSPNEKGTLFYFWNDAQNWTNSAAARGFPQAGDTALIGWGSAGDGPYNVCGNSSSYALHEVRFEGNKSLGMNQGNIVLRGGGGGLKYMHNSSNGNNWMGLYAVGDGEVNHLGIMCNPRGEVVGSLLHVRESALVGPGQHGSQYGIACDDDEAMVANVIDVVPIGRYQTQVMAFQSRFRVDEGLCRLASHCFLDLFRNLWKRLENCCEY